LLTKVAARNPPVTDEPLMERAKWQDNRPTWSEKPGLGMRVAAPALVSWCSHEIASGNTDPEAGGDALLRYAFEQYQREGRDRDICTPSSRT
jgi:hypothetical protein